MAYTHHRVGSPFKFSEHPEVMQAIGLGHDDHFTIWIFTCSTWSIVPFTAASDIPTPHPWAALIIKGYVIKLCRRLSNALMMADVTAPGSAIPR